MNAFEAIARPASMMARCPLLIYGSLLHPDIRHALLGRPVPASPAWLYGYRRIALRSEAFPAVVPAMPAALPRTAVQLKEIPGALIRISPRELRVLDAYENDLYVRRRVHVRDETDNARWAWCYLLKPQCRRAASNRAWSLSRFERRHAARSIIEARRFRVSRG
ncbi:gamma-glutamylcyclotransferase [Sinimarinibacterium sp. CAU 1509]|uniref:gamma-glutamylcyclotransferase family protein n=1 Tax=Sinimarinibacterium sp. CAU 1509 TaxID=2562283 RepID=UPI0010ACC2C7|nr:gamma-glutamylcyclotransferase family protein [Sinimarinibacterium sp. CAU 1509]TJY56660.1 gamma-glutamylcyclotransferase [Sinimarinibacterium sp. CAU 1509]